MLNPITWYSFILGPSVAQCLRPDGLRSVRGRDDGGGHHAAADAHRLPTDGAGGGLGERTIRSSAKIVGLSVESRLETLICISYGGN